MANDDEDLQQQIIHQLDRITASVQFYTDFFNNFKRDQSLHPGKHEQYYLIQGDGRIANFHFNYLTLLKKDNVNLSSEAFEINRKLLLAHPENFIALWCSVEMCLNGDEKDLPQAQEHISLLEKVVQKKNEMILAKTEVGAIYTQFGAEFYRHSIELYEEALSEVSQLTEEETKEPNFYETIMKVKIGLAKNLNKLMSPGMMEEYWPNSGLDHPTLYKKIETLLREVLTVAPLMNNGEHLMDVEDFKRQQSTAWAELGYATSKYKQWENRMKPVGQKTGGRVIPPVAGPPGLMNWRRSTNRSLPRAAFQSLPAPQLDINHRMKLLVIDDLPSPDICFETAMKIDAKTPYVLEKYGQYLRFQANRDRNIAFYTEAIAHFQKALDLEPSRYLTAHELGKIFQSMWLLNNRDTKVWPTTSPQNRDTKFVSNLINPQMIDKPTRIPTWYEACHSFNPISKDPANEHVSQSVKYFKKACELDNNSCSFYLVDLARMYISTNRIEKAKRNLDLAKQLKFTNAKSASTLFVQLAMWYENDMNTNPDHADSIGMAIRYYRSAIGYMAICSFNPNFAFIKLCSLLYQETQSPANEYDAILQREYFITLFVMEKANPRSDLSIFLTHRKMLDEVLKLIQLIHGRGTDHDCAAASVYITILEKKNLSAFRDYFWGSDQQTMLLKISERAARVCFFPENTLSMAYRWFLTLRMQPHDMQMQIIHESMVCLLAQSRKDQKTAKVLQILALCNLPVFQVYTKDFKNSEERSIKNVHLCATVIIKDTNPGGNQNSLKSVFEKIVKVNETIGTKPVCLASVGTPDHIEFVSNYSTWVIPEDIGGTDVKKAVECGFELLKAIFFC